MASGRIGRRGAVGALSLGTPPPGLPALARPPGNSMRGPTPWCNWVIRGHVLAGAYPATLDDRDTEDVLSTLLEAGVQTFVCLQAEVSLDVTEAQWRRGQALRPYIKDAQRVLSRAHAVGSAKITQPKIDFLHLSIIDGSITSDEAMVRLRDDCCQRILRGERLYIHCWGGHGRTGTLVCLILARLYGLPAATALTLCQAYHDSRSYPQHVKSPQTPIQRHQVMRIVESPEGAEQSQAQRRAGISNLVANPPSRTPNAASRFIPRPTPVTSARAAPAVGSVSARRKGVPDTLVNELRGLSLEGSSAARHRDGYSGTAVRRPMPMMPSDADPRKVRYKGSVETESANYSLPGRSAMYA